MLILLSLLAGAVCAAPGAGLRHRFRNHQPGAGQGQVRRAQERPVPGGFPRRAWPGVRRPCTGRRSCIMDQKGLVFIPHVMAMQLGQSVEFLNSDNDKHNVYFLHDETGETLDIGTWGPGTSVTHTFDQAGLFITLCTLHLEMAAYILVFPHPYFCLVEFDEETGQASYSLADVPAGEYELHVWHKKLKQMQGPKTITVVPGRDHGPGRCRDQEEIRQVK